VRAEPPGLVGTLRDLIQDSPHNRTALGGASRTFVERWHDPVKIAERLRDVYEAIVPRRGAR
jgi:hypothetical protein